jgi:ribosome-associated protein
MIAALEREPSRETGHGQLDEHRRAQLARSLDHACHAARAADETRAQEILVLDLTATTPIVDFFVIATASSPRQMRAVADEVHQAMKREGEVRLSREGEQNSSWLLLDYGDVVVHIFSPEGRKQYDLEHLWAHSPRVDWRAALPAAESAPARVPPRG